jgi:hypothetical protein
MIMQPDFKFCQSCGMPLNQPEMFGTESDGSKTEKYCAYCYKDGKFTTPEATLEQMIEISAKGWSDNDPNITYEQAKAEMSLMLPRLERWRK